MLFPIRNVPPDCGATGTANTAKINKQSNRLILFIVFTSNRRAAKLCFAETIPLKILRLCRPFCGQRGSGIAVDSLFTILGKA